MAELTGLDRAGWAWIRSALTYTAGPFSASIHPSDNEPAGWWLITRLCFPGFGEAVGLIELVAPADELGAQRYAEALYGDILVALGQGRDGVTIHCPECRDPWRRAAGVVAAAPERTEWTCPQCRFRSPRSAWVTEGRAE